VPQPVDFFLYASASYMPPSAHSGAAVLQSMAKKPPFHPPFFSRSARMQMPFGQPRLPHHHHHYHHHLSGVRTRFPRRQAADWRPAVHAKVNLTRNAIQAAYHLPLYLLSIPWFGLALRRWWLPGSRRTSWPPRSRRPTWSSGPGTGSSSVGWTGRGSHYSCLARALPVSLCRGIDPRR